MWGLGLLALWACCGSRGHCRCRERRCDDRGHGHHCGHGHHNRHCHEERRRLEEAHRRVEHARRNLCECECRHRCR